MEEGQIKVSSNKDFLPYKTFKHMQSTNLELSTKAIDNVTLIHVIHFYTTVAKSSMMRNSQHSGVWDSLEGKVKLQNGAPYPKN